MLTQDEMNAVYESFDARDWAKAFVTVVQGKPEVATDEGTMLAWFSGAIMRGYDTARNRYNPDVSAP
jgi:hypothetical protein